MKIAIGSDEKTELTRKIIKWLKDKGHELTFFGHLVDNAKKWKWADIGREVARKVATGEAKQGILFCSSGTGVCMAANKIKGARAALVWNPEIAKLARKWNDANILCLSLTATSELIAYEILEKWFSAKFDEEELNEVYKLSE